MKTVGMRTAIILAAGALSAALIPPAKADCGIPRGPRPAAGAFLKAQAMRSALRLGVAGQKPKDTAPPSIVGLWHVTFVSDGQVTDEGFDQWSSDGTEILNDNPPPSTGAVCLGVWAKSGSVFQLKHPSWTFDDSGNLTGTAIIQERLMLADDGQTYQGSFTVDVYDLSGSVLLHLEGDVAAERITVDN